VDSNLGGHALPSFLLFARLSTYNELSWLERWQLNITSGHRLIGYATFERNEAAWYRHDSMPATASQSTQSQGLLVIKRGDLL
jgi:hypothetical protein